MNSLKTIIMLLLALLLIASFAFSQNKIDGMWYGAVNLPMVELEILTKFESDNGKITGLMDIPVQQTVNIPINNISIEGNNVKFEILSGPQTGYFSGELNNDKIKGTFTQSGLEGTFVLNKGEKPKEELPYYTEEVTWQNGEITLAGTLSMPEKSGKYPAVILISGSGPQDRDENIGGFKIFKIIADHLTKNGIAVLRYDDRGVGGSGGSTMQSTLEDYTSDVLKAVELLKSREDIISDKIGLLGHSEGGIVAPMAANVSSDVAFIVLVAGTAVKGNVILTEQNKLILKESEMPETIFDDYIKLISDLSSAAGNGEDISTYQERLSEMHSRMYSELKKENEGQMPDSTQFVNGQNQQMMFTFQTPWMKSFLGFDPSTVLENITIPTLAIFGGKDLQVPVDLNKQPMENAFKKAGNENYNFVVFPDANHLFQKAESGSIENYAKLPKEFVDGFLTTISSWIKLRVDLN